MNPIISPEMVLADLTTPVDVASLFKIMTANEWILNAKNKPIPRMLFSEFWHEGELCILFADTNIGKTLLAVQIADSITKGLPVPGFELQAERQKVAYFDFELSDKQFERRYSRDYEEHYQFDTNLLRIEMDAGDIDLHINYDDFIVGEIEKIILKTGCRVVVIDNITFLNSNNEKANVAAPLMKQLNSLKKKHNLSMLILAHTPKRDLSRPLTVNDIQGSKMVANFMDSSFAIGASTQGPAVRYIKQIKQRNTEAIYHAQNVCVCEIVSPGNFVHFRFLRYGAEWEHLQENSREEVISKVKELSTSGLTQREIAEKLDISLGSVNNYLKPKK